MSDKARTHEPRYGAGLMLYIGFVAVATIIGGLLHLRDHDKWAIGDWLINYQAGFVRRGVTGELALRVGAVLHVSPWLLALLMQWACYGVMFWAVMRLVVGTRKTFWKTALLASPATLAFQVLGPTGGFRKEIILLAGLGMLVVLVEKELRSSVWLAVFLSILGAVCVLSHESLIFFAAYVVAALAIGIDDLPKAIRIAIVPALITGVAFLWVVRHPGNVAMAKVICGSLQYNVTDSLPEPCSGAIAYLGNSTAWARADVAQQASKYHYLPMYPAYAALAALPLVMMWLALWRFPTARRSLTIVATAAGVSFTASLPLFVYGADWGRWIYIHIFSIFLLLLLIDYRQQHSALAATKDERGGMAIGTRPQWFAGIFLLAYASCWDLPFVGGYGLHFGYVQYVWLLLRSH